SEGGSQPDLGAPEGPATIVAGGGDGAAARQDFEDEDERRFPRIHAENELAARTTTNTWVTTETKERDGEDQSAAERSVSRRRRRGDADRLERERVSDTQAAVRAVPMRRVHHQAV